MGDTKRANRAPQIDNLPVACECNSLNSILQTALARLDVSDADRHPIVGFECNRDISTEMRKF